MKALTTTQGTAMAETALCDLHASQPDWRAYVIGQAEGASDWDGSAVLMDCTGNDQLACVVCGAS